MTWRGGLAANRSSRFQAPSENSRALRLSHQRIITNEYPSAYETARTLVAGDKGLLAMDESNPTCNKRFARLGIPQTEEARRPIGS